MNQKIIDEIAALRVEQERIKNRLNALEAEKQEFKPGWYLCYHGNKNGAWLAYITTEDDKRVHEIVYDNVERATAETLARFIPKPATRYDWSNAPEWANWAARNKDGTAVWCDVKPQRLNDGTWTVPTYFIQAAMHQDRILDSLGDWRESLERRPE